MSLKLRVSQKSKIDDTIKFLWESDKGHIFESVGVPFKSKGIFAICLSSQAGCNLGCKLCKTSKYNFNDINLSSEELIEEAIKTKDLLDKEYGYLKFDEFAFMGMGEPLLNLKNVCSCIKVLSKLGFSTSISTVGILKGIATLINSKFKYPPRLQISLHSLNHREVLIPIEKTNPIKRIIPMALEYARKTKTPLTFNWVLLKGVNDSLEEARQIGLILDSSICRINITNYVGDDFVATGEKSRKQFIKEIKKASLINNKNIPEINSFNILGEDINAGCGQLVGIYSELNELK